MKNNIKKIKKAFNDHTTEKFAFRRLSKADCFPLLMATQNPDFNRFLLWDKPEDEADLMMNILKLLREDDSESSAVFSICEKYNGKWVGLLKWAPYQDSMTISFWLHPDYWRTMTAYKVVDSSFDIAFRCTDLDYLYSIMIEGNEVPQKMALKKGASLVGIEHLPHQKGHELQGNVYRVSKEVWKNNTELHIL